MYIYQSKEEVNVQFGKEMNQDINENKNLFQQEMAKAEMERLKVPQNKGWKLKVANRRR